MSGILWKSVFPSRMLLQIISFSNKVMSARTVRGDMTQRAATRCIYKRSTQLYDKQARHQNRKAMGSEAERVVSKFQNEGSVVANEFSRDPT
jgi:uncharacterized protein (UPF0218 family)